MKVALLTDEPGAGHARSPDARRAMRLYGVTEKDMAPAHIRDLCREIGYSRFEFLPDPTLAIIGMYGINLAALKRIDRPWWRRLLQIGRLFADRRLQAGGICVITK